MKSYFMQQLHDHLYEVITRNNWQIDWACEKELNELLSKSIERVSHTDYERAEMRQHAKANLLHLLAYMHLNAKERGVHYLDSLSIKNALAQFKRLWPFKGTVASFKNKSPFQGHNPDFTWFY